MSKRLLGTGFNPNDLRSNGQRGFGIFMLIVILIVTVGVVANTPHKVVPAINPDPRVHWYSYPVEGMLLVNPDSTVRDGSQVLVLPPGSILSIPETVAPGYDDGCADSTHVKA